VIDVMTGIRTAWPLGILRPFLIRVPKLSEIGLKLTGLLLGICLAAAPVTAQSAVSPPLTFDAAWADIQKTRASAEDFLVSTEDLMADGNVTSACSMANQARIRFDEIAAALKTLPQYPKDAAVREAELARARDEIAKRHAHVKDVFKEACS
jgi:hypothetical protein